MKLSKKLIVILSILCLGVFSILMAFCQEWSETEKEIWNNEKTYIESRMKGNIESMAAMWHENFVGWPSWAEQPVKKEFGINAIKERFSQAKLVSFELKPAAIEVFGDVAINHYFLIGIWQDSEGNEVKATTRIMHTWMKQDGKWKIIGGMSSE